MLIDNEKMVGLTESVFNEGVKARVKAEGTLDKIIKTVELQKDDVAKGIPPQGIFVANITPYRKVKKPGEYSPADKAVLGDSPVASNAQNIRNFVQQLKARGWQYQEVVGAWEGSLEPSYVVYGKEDDKTFDDLSEMSKTFNQDAFGYAGKANGYNYGFFDLDRTNGTYSPGFTPDKGLHRQHDQEAIMHKVRQNTKDLGLTTTARTPFSKTEPTTPNELNKWENSVKNPQKDSPEYKKRIIKVLKKKGTDGVKTVGVA